MHSSENTQVQLHSIHSCMWPRGQTISPQAVDVVTDGNDNRVSENVYTIGIVGLVVLLK